MIFENFLTEECSSFNSFLIERYRLYVIEVRSHYEVSYLKSFLSQKSQAEPWQIISFPLGFSITAFGPYDISLDFSPMDL